MRNRFNSVTGFLFVVGLGLFTLAGCEKPDPVSTYIVPHPPVRGTVWTFQLLGGEKGVAAQSDLFKSFVESVTFDPNDGYPVWKLPEGWTESQTARNVTELRLPTTPPLTIEVRPAESLVPIRDLQLQSLFNEQRRSVKLADVGESTSIADIGPGSSNSPQGADDPEQTGPKSEIVGRTNPGDDPDATASQQWLPNALSAGELTEWPLGEHPGYLVQLKGETNQFGSTLLLAAIIPVPIQRSDLPFAFQAPPHWKPAAQTQFSIFARQLTDAAGRTASITVSPAMGGPAANINRWRGQVGLPPLAEEDLVGHLERLEVNGLPAAYTEAIGGQRAILGGLIVVAEESTSDNPSVYFFKFDGDPRLAEQERDNFKAFFHSVKFR